MKLVVVFLVLLIFKSESSVQSTDSGFVGCFSTYNGMRYIEMVCDDKTRPALNRECVKNGDKAEVRVLKYQCDEPLGTLFIKNETFYNLTSLLKIDVSSLNISELGFSSDKLESVKVFTASYNHLVEKDVSVSDRMPNLIEIDLSSNNIKRISKCHFNQNNDLQSLNLAHNLIAHLDNGAFANLSKLKRIDLSHNKIQSISEQLLKENKLLEFLDIRNNPMESFSFKIFSREAGVVKVHLPANKITNLDIDRPNDFNDDEYFENIKTFRASGNQLKNVSEILKRFGRTLQVLSLTNSVIGTLSKDMLEKFNDLKEFTMTHANISMIEVNAFLYQTKIEKLDLSCNELIEVDATIFCKKFFNLKTLNLGGNRLTAIDGVNSANLEKLESLSISNNQFTCDYLRKFVNQWHGKNLKFSSTSSKERTNIQGIDCNNETSSSSEKLNNNVHQETDADADTKMFGVTSCPSTLPYIITIITLCIIIMIFTISEIARYVCQKKDYRKIKSFVKTDIGVQTIELDATDRPFEPIKTNNDPHYEEIEIKSLSSSVCQEDTLPLENRPLPMPPTENKCLLSYGHISNASLPITDQYASVVKKTR
ncbi:leucine-rich repeat-containing G-protein coupled receptor 5-like [Sitodiplosis mosellana]|uniref:leucine-rich repeat-containing G-protein coupled receptor 5-like n=1 Tax=Sitodiplosis mosellana TaxID=263140 RepID=UPI0024450A90|nr:leucine-rich repeat-containing G-protein coupled receptor 5-like [Sitodiplosis mosellana]